MSAHSKTGNGQTRKAPAQRAGPPPPAAGRASRAALRKLPTPAVSPAGLKPPPTHVGAATAAQTPRQAAPAGRPCRTPPPRPDAGVAKLLDRASHALLARRTLGLSPASLGLAAADWWTHLAVSPGKNLALGNHALRLGGAYLSYWMRALARRPGEPEEPSCVPVQPDDRRFEHPGWKTYPFNMLQQAFLAQQDWWHEATTKVRGVSAHHEEVVSFVARQVLDMLAPNNLPASNPEVIEATIDSGGANLLEGARAWWEDVQRTAAGAPPAGSDQFVPGSEVACTPGKVVLRNHLIELIQYSPSTPEVHPEPVLIIPAWIMKYYILDLSQHNSLVKYLVDRGHTVFMISWKNPTGEDRELGMQDYLDLGPFAALDAVQRIVPGARVHAAGYCLGGTLLAIAAAALGARGDQRLATLTLLASQTDFTEAGELSLFIDESQVSFLEDMMWAQGYLDTAQMAGAFQMLRSYDLIWSRMTRDYLLGKRQAPNDLLAWNADATRMPSRMHSEYLRGLYLNNDLAEGRWRVNGQAVSVEDVRQPWFVVGTETDHVAPWTSVYKIHLLSEEQVTFVLTSGGHNAGIVSEPGHAHRHFRWSTREPGAPFQDALQWAERATEEQGSWWPRWAGWLAAHSGRPAAAPPMGAEGLRPLCDAPGTYVLQR